MSVTTLAATYFVYTLKTGVIKLLVTFSTYVLCGFH